MNCRNPCTQNLCPECFATVQEVENAEFEIYRKFYTKMKKVLVFRHRKHFSEYFKLYLKSLADCFNKGINPMRHELLLAYLIGRNPDWNKAPYLSKEEAERRNKIYKKK